MDKVRFGLGLMVSSGLAFLIFMIMELWTEDKTGGYFYFIIFILLNIYFHVAMKSEKN